MRTSKPSTGRAITVICAAALLASVSAHAATPCDFKGVSVGDVATPNSVMKAFGIKQFKIEPEREPLDETLKRAHEVGMIPAAEIAD